MKSLVAILVAAGLFMACNDSAEKQAAAQKARQQTIDSLNLVLAKQKAVDSMQRINDSLATARAKTVEKNTRSSAAATQSGGGEMSTTSSQAAKKKGWSHTAKGAVVGAG
ncbi:MAG: hypothetical protein KGO82_12495, partial [Bacteroidota bacterium]|nr:hypothetical protein [Bacteroidota bacterium]